MPASPSPDTQAKLGAESGLLGSTAGMLEVYKLIARAADTDAPVLITGESGTGKELAAKAIHLHGPRARQPFVAINCGAIIETLLESELFGHARGAFTGAVSETKGLFEQAGAGTLFLDEIGEMSPGLQVKLLRVLEENEVRPVGSTRPVKVHARVIAATNAEVEERIAAGRFRQDLYYRLSVIVFKMPSLRERRLDIPVLISHFMERAAARSGRRITLSTGDLQPCRTGRARRPSGRDSGGAGITIRCAVCRTAHAGRSRQTVYAACAGSRRRQPDARGRDSRN
jgi:DNA-binding NtrC family response regulator